MGEKTWTGLKVILSCHTGELFLELDIYLDFDSSGRSHVVKLWTQILPRKTHTSYLPLQFVYFS